MAHDPFDFPEEEDTRLVNVHVGIRNVTLIDRFVAYRNALASAQGKRLRNIWTRKSMTENFISAQCAVLRAQLEPLESHLGPLPDAGDQAAVDEYARRSLELEARTMAELAAAKSKPKK